MPAQVPSRDRVGGVFADVHLSSLVPPGRVVIGSLGLTASCYLLWVSAFILYVDDETEVRLECCSWPSQTSQ